MFGGDDEDGDFLSPTGGAKLASLFGLDQESSQGNESFQYTAPKQPRKSSNPAPASQKASPTPGAPAVLFATAVQAFRYINGQYVKQGKLGAAVLGNHSTKEYKLLLYLSQQKQVTAAKIHSGFVLTVQSNNYYTFYDDQRQNWSLMFESEKSSSDFCKEVCLAKVNCNATLDTVIFQDLSLGEGPGVENGDSLQVSYTGWLLQNHTIGQMFDSNQNKDKSLRLKIGSGKVIKGWEEGMLGMKKAGSRFIIIPPNLAYGSKGVPDRVPPNSTLIFEALLQRVKFSKDSGSDHASASSRDSTAPSPSPSPAPSVENLTVETPAQTAALGPGRPGEPPLRAKSNSLSEQLTNPTQDATKAKLISRMAKMGQPMLPFLTGAACQPESSDSELEDTSGGRVKDRPAAPSPVQISTAAAGSANAHPHPRTAPPSTMLPVIPNFAAQPGNSHAFQPYSYTQTSLAPTHLQPVSQVFPTQTVPYIGSGEMTSFLMTEARQHNMEVRLAVGKVAEKVEQLTTKIDDYQRQGNVSMGASMSMETSMIMHNIQRIIQENECLKKEVFEKSSRIEEQNHKISELINQNQRYMEQSNLLMEQRNDSLKSSSEQSQARLLQAEQDKVRLTEDLASSTARLSQLQLEATAQQQKAMELQSKLNSVLQDSESSQQRIAGLETQLDELKEAAERAHAQFRTEKQRRKEMELRVNNSEEEVQDLRSDKERLERTLSDRKSNWQAERQRRDDEMEDLRRTNQQELDNLRYQLHKARSSTDSASSIQLCQVQAEMEEEWKGKVKQAVASAREQHGREMAELVEQRDALQEKLTLLQEKFTSMKLAKNSQEQSTLEEREPSEELQNLQAKLMSLEEQAAAEKERLKERVFELEKKLSEQEAPADTASEVKRVMNGVFHSLRREFDLSESYSGQAVLGVIVGTIKSVTLELLDSPQPTSSSQGAGDAEDKEAESEGVKQPEDIVDKQPCVNGEREDQQAATQTSHIFERKAQQVGESVTGTQAEASGDAPAESAKDFTAQTAEEAPTAVQQEGPTVSSPVEVQVKDASSEVDECSVDDKHSPKAFGPPSNPPPPPSAHEDGSVTGGMSEENGEEPFFQTPTKPPAPPSVEEEEDELSLKGRPPPAPLFGDEEDEEDLDWLS